MPSPLPTTRLLSLQQVHHLRRGDLLHACRHLGDVALHRLRQLRQAEHGRLAWALVLALAQGAGQQVRLPRREVVAASADSGRGRVRGLAVSRSLPPNNSTVANVSAIE